MNRVAAVGAALLVVAGCSQADPEINCALTSEAIFEIVPPVDGDFTGLTVDVVMADFGTERYEYAAAIQLYATQCVGGGG